MQESRGDGAVLAGRAVRSSVTETLERERQQLVQRLADVDEALGVLKANPDVQKVIDVVSKHTRF